MGRALVNKITLEGMICKDGFCIPFRKEYKLKENGTPDELLNIYFEFNNTMKEMTEKLDLASLFSLQEQDDSLWFNVIPEHLSK